MQCICMQQHQCLRPAAYNYLPIISEVSYSTRHCAHMRILALLKLATIIYLHH